MVSGAKRSRIHAALNEGARGSCAQEQVCAGRIPGVWLVGAFVRPAPVRLRAPRSAQGERVSQGAGVSLARVSLARVSLARVS